MLGAVFKLAERYRWVDYSPVSTATKVRSKSHVIALMHAQIARLIVEADTDTALRIQVAASTGVRRSEIPAAKWSDVNWDNGTLYIGETKNGEPVLTPLSQAAIARLNMIPRSDDNPYIICGDIPGEPLVYLVGAVLNHKDQKTTAGYAYFQTEDRQRALDRHGQAVVQVTQNGARRWHPRNRHTRG